MGSSHDRPKKPMMSPSVRSPAQKETRSKSDERLRPKPTVTGAQGGALKSLGKTPNQSGSQDLLAANTPEARFLALDDNQLEGIANILAGVASSESLHPNPSDSLKAFEAAFRAIPPILRECQDRGLTDLAQIAYLLATATKESFFGASNLSWAPGHNWMYEWPGNANLANPTLHEQYFAQKYDHREDIGNRGSGSGDGYTYRGRGFVQLTGRALYERATEESNGSIDFLAAPDYAAEPDIAAGILVSGMKEGWYTGLGFDDINLNDSLDANTRAQQFYNARRIVNGTDRADQFAELAEQYYQVLRNII